MAKWGSNPVRALFPARRIWTRPGKARKTHFGSRKIWRSDVYPVSKPTGFAMMESVSLRSVSARVGFDADPGRATGSPKADPNQFLPSKAILPFRTSTAFELQSLLNSSKPIEQLHDKRQKT